MAWGTHGREEDDFLDVVRVGQEHGKTINPDPEPTGGRETVFEGLDEGLIDPGDFVVTSRLGLHLFFETLALDDGVVEFGVGVTDFLLENEEFETFSQARHVTVVLGERRHDFGVVHDEGRAVALDFDEFTDELIEETSGGLWGRAGDVVLSTLFLEEGVGFVGLEGEGDLGIEDLFEFGNHGDALEWWGEVNEGGFSVTLTVVPDLVGPVDGKDHLGNHLFGHLNEVVIVSIGHIELTGGEFGVVGKIDAFVTELAADFVDAVVTTDDELLEEELRGNTHEHILIKIVVVGLEGLGGGTTDLDGHHGGFNFEETTFVKETTDKVDDLGTDGENGLGLGVGEKVEVALAETDFLVLDTEVGIGEDVETRGDELDVGGEEGEFTSLGATWLTAEPDDITTANNVMVFPSDLIVLVVTEDLNLSPIGFEGVEDEVLGGLTDVHEATADGNVAFRSLFGAGKSVVGSTEVWDGHGRAELVWVNWATSALGPLVEEGKAVFLVLVRVKFGFLDNAFSSWSLWWGSSSLGGLFSSKTFGLLAALDFVLGEFSTFSRGHGLSWLFRDIRHLVDERGGQGIGQMRQNERKEVGIGGEVESTLR